MSGQSIHRTAIVHGDVQLADDATIGPYCILEGKISIGPGTRILGHTMIEGSTRIGANCRIGPHAMIGGPPQHARFDGSETFLTIEDNVTVREFASLHRAMKPGVENATRVGPDCLLMAGSHVGHDCVLGSHVTMANTVQLGGHVVVGNNATIGGGTVVHQFVRIGRLCMIAGGEALAKDIMPFGAVFHSRHKGYNAIGCKRACMDRETLHALRGAFHEIHSHLSPLRGARALRDKGAESNPIVRELIEFIEASKRGILPCQAGFAAQHGFE